MVVVLHLGDVSSVASCYRRLGGCRREGEAGEGDKKDGVAAAAGLGVEDASPAPAGREQACRRQAERVRERQGPRGREKQLCLWFSARPMKMF
jgi:hypothetical protein